MQHYKSKEVCLNNICKILAGDSWPILLEYYIEFSIEIWRKEHKHNYAQVMVDLAFTYAGRWNKKFVSDLNITNSDNDSGED